MVFTCKICKNRSNLGMFGPPSKPSALNNWRIAAKIPDDTKTSNFKLCFRHFESNNIEAVIKIEYSLKNKGKKCVILKVLQPDFEIEFHRSWESKVSKVRFCNFLIGNQLNLTDYIRNCEKIPIFWKSDSLWRPQTNPTKLKMTKFHFDTFIKIWKSWKRTGRLNFGGLACPLTPS